jgi:hypothetical protein
MGKHDSGLRAHFLWTKIKTVLKIEGLNKIVSLNLFKSVL